MTRHFCGGHAYEGRVSREFRLVTGSVHVILRDTAAASRLSPREACRKIGGISMKKPRRQLR